MRPGLVVRASNVLVRPASRSLATIWERTAIYDYLPVLLGAAGWWRSNFGITIATGVSQWDDQSGNARHLAQATGTKQPAFAASGGPRNRPVIAADGVDDFLRVAFALNQPCMVNIVCKWNAAFAATDTMFDGSIGSRGRFHRTAATTLNIESPTTLPATATTPTEYHYYTLTYNGASSNIAQDLTSLATGDAGAGNPGAVNLFTYGDLASNPCNGSVVEVAVFGTPLAGAAKTRMAAYLAAGIASA